LPWDFWRLTPAELHRQYAGYQKRIEGEYHRLAWLACHLPLAMGVKKGTKLTPEKLLGKKPKRE
jgi:hypothetical protein